MKTLVNEEINDLKEKITSFNEELSAILYDQYKSSLVLSRTKNLRGKTGDAFKNYIDSVHINLTQKIINISLEITDAVNKMQENFISVEKYTNGIVDTNTIKAVTQDIKNSNNKFEDLHSQSYSLMSKASEFISTVGLPYGNVTNTYGRIERELKKSQDKIEEMDSQVSNDLLEIEERVLTLKEQLSDIINNYHNDSGIVYSKVNTIKNEEWYSNESRAAFKQMAEDDPYFFEANTKNIYEDQWVTGNNDVFISSDIAVLNATGQTLIQNGNQRHEGSVDVITASSYGQFTEYATINASGRILGADGHVEFGDDGIDVGGSVNVVKVDGSAMIGDENFNGYIKASADVLSADGNFVIKPPNEKGEYNYNVTAKASGATAKIQAGVTLFSVDNVGGSYNDSNNNISKKTTLLGADVSGSVGWQAGIGGQMSRTTVFETDLLDVRANKIALDANLGLGLKFDMNYPTIKLKWPW